MKLRYSTNDIFWNKDNEIKPNKNAFDRYLADMQEATNFAVSWVDELTIKINVPINNIWKFIEIDDLKNTKFSKRYYFLSSILSKNNVNCECMFSIDVWTTFVLNNFDKIYTNRTNDLTKTLYPSHDEFILPRTERKALIQDKPTQGLRYKQIPSSTNNPDSEVFNPFYNTNLYHIFYTQADGRVRMFYNSTGTVQESTQQIKTVIDFQRLIENSANLWYEDKPLTYITSFIGPNYTLNDVSNTTFKFSTEPDITAFENKFASFNPHLDRTGQVFKSLISDFWKKEIYSLITFGMNTKPIYEIFDRETLLALSNGETNYLGLTVSQWWENGHIEILDSIVYVNENVNSNLHTRIPYVENEYLKSIKQNAASFNTSLTIAEQNYKLQKKQAKQKMFLNILESATMGPAQIAAGAATGNVKAIMGGIRETVFGVNKAAQDGIHAAQGLKQQYKNTLETAKAQRADIANNSTATFTTYDTQFFNYRYNKTRLALKQTAEIMYYYCDLEYAKKMLKFYGFYCLPYELPITPDLDSYIRSQLDWLDLNIQYYNGLSPAEIQAVKMLLIQGVRVSNG